MCVLQLVDTMSIFDRNYASIFDPQHCNPGSAVEVCPRMGSKTFSQGDFSHLAGCCVRTVGSEEAIDLLSVFATGAD